MAIAHPLYIDWINQKAHQLYFIKSWIRLQPPMSSRLIQQKHPELFLERKKNLQKQQNCTSVATCPKTNKGGF